MDLGDWTPRSGLSYLDEDDWNTGNTRIGSYDFKREKVIIPRVGFDPTDYQRVEVPDRQLFRFGKRENLPKYSPHVSFRGAARFLTPYNNLAQSIAYIRRPNGRYKQREEIVTGKRKS